MLVMLITQIGAHGFMTYEVINGLEGKNAAPATLLHVATFMYFLYRFGVVVHDVYTQNFIMSSIGR